jgi:hypothetical protein
MFLFKINKVQAIKKEGVKSVIESLESSQLRKCQVFEVVELPTWVLIWLMHVTVEPPFVHFHSKLLIGLQVLMIVGSSTFRFQCQLPSCPTIKEGSLYLQTKGTFPCFVFYKKFMKLFDQFGHRSNFKVNCRHSVKISSTASTYNYFQLPFRFVFDSLLRRLFFSLSLSSLLRNRKKVSM